MKQVSFLEYNPCESNRTYDDEELDCAHNILDSYIASISVAIVNAATVKLYMIDVTSIQFDKDGNCRVTLRPFFTSIHDE